MRETRTTRLVNNKQIKIKIIDFIYLLNITNIYNII